MNDEVGFAETVVIVVGPKVDMPETGLGPSEDTFERSNDVSGTKTIMKSTAKAWITLTTMSWFRNVCKVCETTPPRIGDPQVNIKLTVVKMPVRRPLW